MGDFWGVYLVTFIQILTFWFFWFFWFLGFFGVIFEFLKFSKMFLEREWVTLGGLFSNFYSNFDFLVFL